MAAIIVAELKDLRGVGDAAGVPGAERSVDLDVK